MIVTYELVILVTLQPGSLAAQVPRILQQLLVACSDVKHNWQDTLGVEAPRRHVQVQLALGDERITLCSQYSYYLC